VRLRRSDPRAPGITRVRRGGGFSYHDINGALIVDETVRRRIRELAVPPAWTDVWICPWPHGHIQATGVDAAGRTQYRYHAEWRRLRDLAKHDRVLALAADLPAARRRAAAAVRGSALSRERVLAGCFRLLDAGSLRIGGEGYAKDNESFGLSTLRRDHVRVLGDAVAFEFVGKSSTVQTGRLRDRALARLVAELLVVDDEHPELFGWWTEQGWHDLRSAEVNAYLRDLLGGGVSAKDFRTWNATVLMAQRLGAAHAPRATQRRRQQLVRAAYADVADYLGNTPAVARSAYVDPRVVDLFHAGVVVPADVLPRRDVLLPVHPKVEAAVRALLTSGVLAVEAAA
jgi:DNA topoisomerase IB